MERKVYQCKYCGFKNWNPSVVGNHERKAHDDSRLLWHYRRTLQ